MERTRDRNEKNEMVSIGVSEDVRRSGDGRWD